MWKALVFGVVVAAAIGPIALLVFGTGARQGFAAGAFAGLGAAMLIGQLRLRTVAAAAQPAARSFLPTFGLTIVNPMTLVVFAGIVPQLPVAGSLARAAGLAAVLAAGSAAVGIAIGSCGAALGKTLQSERARRAAPAAAAAGILVFGLYGLATAF